MLYTELLRLWDEAVKAVDARDWQGALSKLNQITEPTSRTLFLTASAHLALGQLEPAIQALDQTIAKDERLAVGFFQRAGTLIMASRLEEALNDCISAQKHMRGNVVIDYRQLGLRYKLYSWQVLYNAAAVHSRLNQLDKARDILLSASQEKGGGGRGLNVEVALHSLSKGEVLPILLVPEGEVFRPRKQDVEQLGQRDFLGKPMVISSMIPNDDFGGFEPLRINKPGYYEPKVDRVEESRYMRLRTPYMSQAPGQLTVPGGAIVFLFSDADRDGLAMVIHDGQKGLVPMTLLDPVDVNKSKGRKKNKSIPSGIPLPPGLKPPTRPQSQLSHEEPPQERPDREASPPSSASATHPPTTSTPPPRNPPTVDSPTELTEDPLANRTILYHMVALYDYAAEGPEDLEFSEGDTIDILSEVNEEWLEGHCAGNIGIFPSLFAYREGEAPSTIDRMTMLLSNKE
ncbi:neutrophil cytosol factor 2 isoform X2 [Salmo salar]|nr:neutrophil cytosol factor 2-like isoform X2 [Salmo salar]XP_014017519.1 neutrophil cytosol factor 2-like isoform X2 [Salmo salar]|eukprot:XP_014017518.1 PREDICTED: neutrophil cytosol factor 2-like isoform X2 [Salmo salar]